MEYGGSIAPEISSAVAKHHPNRDAGHAGYEIYAHINHIHLECVLKGNHLVVGRCKAGGICNVIAGVMPDESRAITGEKYREV